VVHPSALARLTLEMTEVVVPPGELLLLEGDVCSTSAPCDDLNPLCKESRAEPPIAIDLSVLPIV
jgi:hypothetical protein